MVGPRRDPAIRTGCSTSTAGDGEEASETTYYDFDDDKFLSDDERDEDADGLTNYDETHGRMTGEVLVLLLRRWRSPTPSSTRAQMSRDPDTDGDRVRDGADDQDHDDVPNLMELSSARGLRSLGC